jgi:hypothetical protein
MQQNNERKPSVETFGYKSINEDTQTCLAVRYFERTAAIGIHLPVKDGNKSYLQFDYKGGAIAYLQPRDCKAIHKKGSKVLKKFEETGEFESFAIGLKKGLIEFASARDLKNKLKHLTGDVNPNDICAVVYLTGDDSKRSNEYLVHVFNQDKIVKGYQPDNGSYSVEYENSEFDYFLDALYDFAKAMTNGYVHAQNHEDRYSQKRLEQNIFMMLQALNVDISKPMAPAKGGNSGGSKGNWSGGNSFNSNRGGGQSQGQEIETENPTDEELERIIAQMTEGDE